eukprot:6191388-Pleurochrysis_carterae.AAC.3
MGEFREMSGTTRLDGSFDQIRRYAARMDRRLNPVNLEICCAEICLLRLPYLGKSSLNWSNAPWSKASFGLHNAPSLHPNMVSAT